MQKNNSENERIQYHPGFVSGLEVLLWDYRNSVEIKEEQVLKTGGVRVDIIILKKDPDVQIDFDICRIFAGHNIVEYKRPDDDLNIDVFSKVMSYVYLYKSVQNRVNAFPFSELTATIYRHIYPGEFFKQIQENGGSIEKRYPGVYIISGVGLFNVQVVVGKELAPKEYAMLRVLTPDAEEEDIRLFSETIKKRNEAKYREYLDGIYQVSVSANRELYVKMMKEDRGMCDALRELMKDEFMETEARGEARGISIGEARGEARGISIGEVSGAIKIYHEEMGLSPSEIKKKIMGRFSLDKESAEEYITKALRVE